MWRAGLSVPRPAPPGGSCHSARGEPASSQTINRNHTNFPIYKQNKTRFANPTPPRVGVSLTEDFRSVGRNRSKSTVLFSPAKLTMIATNVDQQFNVGSMRWRWLFFWSLLWRKTATSRGIQESKQVPWMSVIVSPAGVSLWVSFGCLCERISCFSSERLSVRSRDRAADRRRRASQIAHRIHSSCLSVRLNL